MILLQPYRSRSINNYHTIVPFVVAVANVLVIILEEAQIKDQRVVSIVTPFIGLFFIFPLFAAVSYIVYRVLYGAWKKRQTVCLWMHRHKSLEFKHLATEQEHNYQTINIQH